MAKAGMTVVSGLREFGYERVVWILRTSEWLQEQLDSVILFGGNTRVPMVQASIKELAGQ